MPSNAYNDGSCDLQQRFDTGAQAGRAQHHLEFTDDDRAFVERSGFFFLATVDADGSPDCSYKGGLPGFVRTVGDDTLAWPDYKGNGQFRSLGNIIVNPQVGILFLDFENPGRRRINGTATLHYDDPLLAEYPDARLIVRVKATEIFGNCPRFVPKMQLVEHSPAAPPLTRPATAAAPA